MRQSEFDARWRAVARPSRASPTLPVRSALQSARSQQLTLGQIISMPTTTSDRLPVAWPAACRRSSGLMIVHATRSDAASGNQNMTHPQYSETYFYFGHRAFLCVMSRLRVRQLGTSFFRFNYSMHRLPDSCLLVLPHNIA
jgi:hypothetical protein